MWYGLGHIRFLLQKLLWCDSCVPVVQELVVFPCPKSLLMSFNLKFFIEFFFLLQHSFKSLHTFNLIYEYLFLRKLFWNHLSCFCAILKYRNFFNTLLLSRLILITIEILLLFSSNESCNFMQFFNIKCHLTIK